jgi:NDP-sugar pyrophosphorylase family protein
VTAPAPSPRGAGAGPAAICAVILAAGEGRRLRPLTSLAPKALCPVGNVPLLDHALRRVAGLGLIEVAVNASYLAHQVVAHVGDRAFLSVEPDGPLGTSGGIAKLRDWIDGRGVLVGNADAYLADPVREPGKDVAAVLDGWSGETVRMLVRPLPRGEEGGFSNHRFAGFSLLPWKRVRDLVPSPSGLVRDVWRPAEAGGELELIVYDGTYIDTGTPADYLRANLHAAAGDNLIAPSATVTGRCEASVVGPSATVAGRVTGCVVWAGATVTADETLTGAIRAGQGLTVDGRR